MSLAILLFAIIAVMVAVPFIDAVVDWYRSLPEPADHGPDNPMRRMRRVAAAKSAKRRHRKATSPAERLLHQIGHTAPNPVIPNGGEGGNEQTPTTVEPAPQLLGRLTPEQHRASDVRPYIGEQRGKHWMRDQTHDTATFQAITDDTPRPVVTPHPLAEPSRLVGADR